MVASIVLPVCSHLAMRSLAWFSNVSASPLTLALDLALIFRTSGFPHFRTSVRQGVHSKVVATTFCPFAFAFGNEFVAGVLERNRKLADIGSGGRGFWSSYFRTSGLDFARCTQHVDATIVCPFALSVGNEIVYVVLKHICKPADIGSGLGWGLQDFSTSASELEFSKVPKFAFVVWAPLR